MAAKKSIAKGARTHNAAPKGRASDYPGRPLKPRSSAKSQSRHRKPAPRPRRGLPLNEQRAELLETLSNRLSLVETASLALQKFGDDPDVGAVCASLEQAVRMLANAHEQVDQFLFRCMK